MQMKIDATGSAPAETAWERYMDPSQWSSWAPQIMGVEASDDRLTAGTTGHVSGPLWLRIDFEVLSVDETERTWEWRAWFVNRALGLTLIHGVEAQPAGSRTWLTVKGSPALVLPYLPVAKFALSQLVRP